MSCIWYVSKYVTPPNKGSAGSRGFMIMRELARTGHECLVITSDSNHLAEAPQLHADTLIQEIDGICVCWVRTLKYSVAKSLRRILSWLDFEWRLWRLPKGQFPVPDVVVVSSLSLLTILNGFLLRSRYGCRLVFEIRDIWPLTIVEEGGFSKWNPLVMALGFVERIGYKRSDVVVGTMPNLGEHVAKILGHKREVACIPMGIDPSVLTSQEPISADYLASYVPKGKFVVAHVGSIGITNALEPFFECAKVLQAREDIHFLMVGDGDLREHFQHTYRELKNLTFAPKVPKQRVLSVLEVCDLLYFSVHVSEVWRYGQSLNKVIDYMLAGKPIVASYTGFPSMINEAGCGTYVPAGDVERLCAEILRYRSLPESERNEIGDRGRVWILANRSYTVLAQNYLSLMFHTAGGNSNENEALV